MAQNRQHSFRSASLPSRHFMQTAFRNRARPSFFTCEQNTKKRTGVRQAIKSKKNTQIYERHKNIMLKSLRTTPYQSITRSSGSLSKKLPLRRSLGNIIINALFTHHRRRRKFFIIMISELARLFLYTILLRLPSELFLLSVCVSVCVKQYAHRTLVSRRRNH